MMKKKMKNHESGEVFIFMVSPTILHLVSRDRERETVPRRRGTPGKQPNEFKFEFEFNIRLHLHNPFSSLILVGHEKKRRFGQPMKRRGKTTAAKKGRGNTRRLSEGWS